MAAGWSTFVATGPLLSWLKMGRSESLTGDALMQRISGSLGWSWRPPKGSRPPKRRAPTPPGHLSNTMRVVCSAANRAPGMAWSKNGEIWRDFRKSAGLKHTQCQKSGDRFGGGCVRIGGDWGGGADPLFLMGHVGGSRLGATCAQPAVCAASHARCREGGPSRCGSRSSALLFITRQVAHGRVGSRSNSRRDRKPSSASDRTPRVSLELRSASHHCACFWLDSRPLFVRRALYVPHNRTNEQRR